MIPGIVLLVVALQADTLVDCQHALDEVVVVSREQGRKRSAKGQSASIDEHLSELSRVQLVRRGAYAWEPVVNNMQTERVSTTIDGMKIFYACTDKMDPVTSYVESGNLQRITLNSGLDGNPQATGNIGGSLDLRLRKAGFGAAPLRLNASVGYETNGSVQAYGADAAHSSNRFYAGGGVFCRRADDYRAGGGWRVLFSQFSKVNAFCNIGVRLSDRDALEGTLIFDRATDVGYPALNMDVAKAQAFITSLSLNHRFRRATWETKLYYNHITHEMDDTQRPDTPIHMDMPGRSQTAGLYSMLSMAGSRHDLQLNYDAYYNRLFADMTMYPGGAAPMYMVTWPDVATLNMGIALADAVALGERQSLRLSAKVAWQQQRLNSDEGFKALRVFFPAMTDSYRQLTGRLAVSYRYAAPRAQFAIGAGWGSRAPTPTEAYGYYLNNTFDLYDYMGNPSLKNESAVELNAQGSWTVAEGLTVGFEANSFFFSDYIIGQPDSRLSAMTIGAKGVKVYGNISRAIIANTSLSARWAPLPQWSAEATATYAAGRDADGDCLPLIAPLGYRARLAYDRGPLSVGAEVKGSARQSDYAPKYGEQPTAAYAVCSLSASYRWTVITLRVGMENVFDKTYATYADWNDIPQKGRNAYINLTLHL